MHLAGQQFKAREGCLQSEEYLHWWPRSALVEVQWRSKVTEASNANVTSSGVSGALAELPKLIVLLCVDAVDHWQVSESCIGHFISYFTHAYHDQTHLFALNGHRKTRQIASGTFKGWSLSCTKLTALFTSIRLRFVWRIASQLAYQVLMTVSYWSICMWPAIGKGLPKQVGTIIVLSSMVIYAAIVMWFVTQTLQTWLRRAWLAPVQMGEVCLNVSSVFCSQPCKCSHQHLKFSSHSLYLELEINVHRDII